jgi:hypothetical protein
MNAKPAIDRVLLPVNRLWARPRHSPSALLPRLLTHTVAARLVV